MEGSDLSMLFEYTEEADPCLAIGSIRIGA